MDRHYSNGTSHNFPVVELAAEHIEQCSGCTWHCSVFLLQMPKDSKYCNLQHSKWCTGMSVTTTSDSQRL